MARACRSSTARPDPRALLHDQARRRRNRPRPFGLPRHHRAPMAVPSTIDDRPGGGARFVVTLPACAARVRIGAKRRHRSAARHRRRRPGRRRRARGGGDARGGAGRDGHRVTTAPDGAAALELLRTGTFDAVLCDLRMPRLDGPGLFRELEATRPDLAARLLLMTGDALRAARRYRRSSAPGSWKSRSIPRRSAAGWGSWWQARTRRKPRDVRQQGLGPKRGRISPT